MLLNSWRIEMLGGLAVHQTNTTTTRFKTSNTGALLAYLAGHSQRRHPRELLAEQIWPDVDLSNGLTSLRSALASLRKQLENPAPHGSLFISDNTSIILNPNAFTTDVADFDAHLKRAATAPPKAQRSLLEKAVALYRGEFLPGYYEEWILAERRRLAADHLNAQWQLASLLQAQNEPDLAADHLQAIWRNDPLSEEAICAFMRIRALQGNPDAVRRAYREWEEVLRETWEEAPSEAVQLLYAEIINAPTVFPLPSISTPDPRPDPELPAPPEPPPGVRLPNPLTSFCGREAEIAQAGTLLIASEQSRDLNVRLLTLTGFGGAGKTRLAIEIARRFAGNFEAVRYISLADLTDARLIEQAILIGLGGLPHPNRDTFTEIVRILQTYRTLLVLDNFETVLNAEGAGEGIGFVTRLLLQTSRLKCIVTSRHRLSLPGEWEIVVPPLPIPEGSETPQQLAVCPSVQLYVDRVRAKVVDFAVTPRNVSAIAALSRRLEGIPLAIELAAARGGLLSPAQILDQLRTDSADMPDRHRTLRTVIEWSYNCLPPELQRFFARLSVFRGGCSLEQAQTVLAERQALTYLGQMRDYALLQMTPQADEVRFSLLEMLREFAVDTLTPTEHEALSQAHLKFFLALAERANAHLFGPEAAVWLDRLEREKDNLRAALGYTMGEETSLRLAGKLNQFWLMRGYVREGLHTTQEALHACSEATASVRTSALNSAGVFASLLHDYTTAQEAFEEALPYREQAGDDLAVAGLLTNIGLLLYYQGELTEARERMEQSIALYRKLCKKDLLANGLANLAGIALDQNDLTLAAGCLREGKTLQVEIDDPSCRTALHKYRGRLLLLQGKLPAAQTQFEAGLTLQCEIKNPADVIGLCLWLGRTAHLHNRIEQAAHLYLLAQHLCTTTTTSLPPNEQRLCTEELTALRAQISPQRFASLENDVRQISLTAVLQRYTGHISDLSFPLA